MTFGKIKLEIFATPGHTPGSIIYVERSEKAVFCGDIVFNGGVGISYFPGGDERTLLASLEHKLLVLPNDFGVFQGHGRPTTIRGVKSNM